MWLVRKTTLGFFYMKVLQLKELQREEGQIFYLRKYTCIIVLELPTGVENAEIKFSIETTETWHV